VAHGKSEARNHLGAGWKLSSYHRNPVFQNAHQYGDVIFTLGKALVTEIRAGKLYQRIQFATDINPMARIAYGLYRGKFLNAVSVGSSPSAGKTPTHRTQGGARCPRRAWPPSPIRWERGWGEGGLHSTLDTRHSTRSGFRRRYLEQELLEVSAVAIPANPNALALGLKSGALEKSDLRDLSDLLRLTLDHPAAPAPSLSPRERAGVRGNNVSNHPALTHSRPLSPRSLEHT